MVKKTKTQSLATQKSRYTNFYLTMLILSTVFISFSAYSVLDIPNLIIHFSSTPLYSTLMLLSIASVPLSIAALVLLYRKQKLGLVLTFVLAGAGVVFALIMPFLLGQALDYFMATTDRDDIQALGGIDSFTAALSIFWYGAAVTSFILSVAYPALWHYAWQSQYASDHGAKAAKSKR